VRFEVAKFLPNGVPVYREKVDASLGDHPYYRLSDGGLYRMGDGQVDEAGIGPDGKQRWAFATEGRGVHSLYSAKPWRPGQVVAQFSCVGHETAHAGDLGEFLVFSTNVGTWNLWTADGLLAGRIFRDIRDPQRTGWSMADFHRGLDLADVTAGQEHFQGCFRKTADNRYYVVAGHNHASVVEVIGIDKFRRYPGTVRITPKEIRTARSYRHGLAAVTVHRKAPVMDCYRLTSPPAVDGDATDWQTPVSAEIRRSGAESVKLRIGYTARTLFLCYEAAGCGPMKNTGNDWRKAFKSGSAVDLQLGTDPAAKHDRKAPVAGDQRLLMTFLGTKPLAVLYQPVADGAQPAEAWKVVSPVGTATFDRVTKAPGVRLARGGKGGAYVLEAAVPLEALGLKIAPGVRIKIDWGVLVSGADGHEVLRRLYWANQATNIVSDAPSEARLHPDLWGHVRFHDAPRTGPRLPGAGETKTGPNGKTRDEILDDLLNKGK